MHPSGTNNNIITNYSNGKTCSSTFSTNENINQQKKTTSNVCNYPHYLIPLLEEEEEEEDQQQQQQQQPPINNIVPRDLLQHLQPFTNDLNYHAATTDDHMQQQQQQQQQVRKSSSSYINNGKFVAADGLTAGGKGCSCRKLLCLNKKKKKDRHSKINTARGPRDRRMRLSLDVAKKFFRLQDILGFDKASNTIQWLLIKSKPAIQALFPPLHFMMTGAGVSSNTNSPTSSDQATGTEEVVSGIINDDHQSQVILAKLRSSCSSTSNKDRQKKNIDSRKSSNGCSINHLHSDQAKETRNKARARARKRTTEKKMKINTNSNKLLVVGIDDSKVTPSSLDQVTLDQNINPRLIGSNRIPFGSQNNQQVQQAAITDEAAAAAAEYYYYAADGSNYNYFHQFKQQQAAAAAGINYNNNSFSVGDHNSSSSMSSCTNNWISSPSGFLFNYQHNNPAAAAGPSQDQVQHDQFSDFQILGNKPWE